MARSSSIEIFSIFGQIERVAAQIMIDNGEAKRIDVKDFPLDRRCPGRRWAGKRKPDVVIDRLPELGGLGPKRQMTRHRREDIAPVEGRADRLEEVSSGGNGPDPQRSGLLSEWGKQSVVRANEQMAVASGQDRPARPPYPRVNHRDMDRRLGEVAVSGSENKCRLGGTVRPGAMA